MKTAINSLVFSLVTLAAGINLAVAQDLSLPTIDRAGDPKNVHAGGVAAGDQLLGDLIRLLLGADRGDDDKSSHNPGKILDPAGAVNSERWCDHVDT